LLKSGAANSFELAHLYKEAGNADGMELPFGVFMVICNLPST